MHKRFDVAVVGAGMIGASAARHLTMQGLSVTVVGPPEPHDWQLHNGVFSSHYDEARITRIIEPDPVWTELAARSISSYQEIENASGITFHYPVGCLRVSPLMGQPDDTLLQSVENGDKHGAVYERLSPAELAERYPYLSFHPDSYAYWETGGAGYVNPRALVAAQQHIASASGAALIQETVLSVDPVGSGVRLNTDKGTRILADRVLLTTGAFTNRLLNQPLELHPRVVSVLLVELDRQEQRRLQELPSIIYRLDNHPLLFSIYSLPPVRYPDGKIYYKIGGPLHVPNHLYTSAELVDWFHGDGDSAETDALHQVLSKILPNLRAVGYHTRPCVVTYTAHGHPYIDLLGENSPAPERVFVAVGGCGAAGKSSVEVGRIAASMVAANRWDDNLPAEWFKCQSMQEGAQANQPRQLLQ